LARSNPFALHRSGGLDWFHEPVPPKLRSSGGSGGGRRGRGGRDGGVGLVAAAADLDPDVVATTGRHAVEPIVADVVEPLFDGTELLERDQTIGRQQLRQHAGHHLECQAVRGDVNGVRARHDVRPFSDVHHQRVAIGANDR
jgi:hypothetical protein